MNLPHKHQCDSIYIKKLLSGGNFFIKKSCNRLAQDLIFELKINGDNKLFSKQNF